jgi:hypothetical protein
MFGFLRSIFWSLFRRLFGPTVGEVGVAMLCHQVMVLRRQLGQRPKLTRWDRVLFAALYHVQPEVLRSISIVRPETVVRWHRLGFRLFWKHKSHGKVGRLAGLTPFVPAL